MRATSLRPILLRLGLIVSLLAIVGLLPLQIATLTEASSSSPSPFDEWPEFVLPYGSSENGEIRWTGGPHAWGLLDGLATFKSGEGSGLDFARDDHQSFDVLAMATGTVEDASCGSLGLGCSVAIRHFTGNSVMVYGHLDSYVVQQGEHVIRGQPLGRAGSTGTDHLHLHIELRDGSASCNVAGRCMPGGRFGNPIGWDDLVELVDGYYIGGYIADSDGVWSYNYDGSAVRGQVKVMDDFGYKDCTIEGVCETSRTAIARVHSEFVCTDTTNCEHNSPAGANPGTQFAGHGILALWELPWYSAVSN